MITQKGKILSIDTILRGSLVDTLFGGPRTTSIEVRPNLEEVTIHASYGSYTIKGDEINSNPVCRRYHLRYHR